MAVVNLFCLPFAGGSNSAYHRLVRLAPPWMRVMPVELPGRGTRYHEPRLTSLDDMAADAFDRIAPLLAQPYALYGHSMGALLGYVLAARIHQAGCPRPLHLFLSGRAAPTVPGRTRYYHLLEPAELKQVLAGMGGIPEEILRDERLMDFFLPIIRADFRATETYRYQEGPKLDVPITVMFGADETFTEAEAAAWGTVTDAPVEVRQFAGNHFFIFQYEAHIMELVARRLGGKSCLLEVR
ncbi:MAG: thioesterase [Cytophagales bacterium]|nr:thioesterase [Cytophagales bacterium]